MEQLYTAVWTAEEQGKTLYYLLARKNIDNIYIQLIPKNKNNI